MKIFSTIALTASFAFVTVTAQDTTGIPGCALICFANAVPAAGCDLSDTICQCTTGRVKIQEELESCLPGKCSDEDIAEVSPAVQNICAEKGITLSDVPTATGTTHASKTASETSETGGQVKITGSNTAGGVQHTGAAVANFAAGMGGVAVGVMAAVVGF